jgi:hypothetical protein
MANRLGKFALWVGSTLTFLTIGGAGTVTYPSYTAYYYSAAIGLSLIVGGLLTLNLTFDDQHDTHRSCLRSPRTNLECLVCDRRLDV